MGKSRKIKIKTRTFENAGDATAFFKEILNRYEIGKRLTQEDSADLMALLERHDERDEKIGSGVAGFIVDAPPEDAPPFSTRCFWIVQNSGNIVDFSYKHCLERKPSD
ncbi:DCL family protein [Erythrobacter aureus]|uniref:DCL family protein n=1 Tax=Erythrobacter aureus TaxID=2182384 RepID=UPI003A906E52